MIDPSLVTLLDDYAMNSMIALMQIHAPEEWPSDIDKTIEWCDWISSCSYFMAASMMDARRKLHGVFTEVQQEKQEEESNA